MNKNNKFKLFSKYQKNILDHPKIKYNKLKSRKWLRLKTVVPRKLSEYGNLLRAKQVLKAFYGNINEKQLINIYKRAKSLKGNTGLNFIKVLECRLDIILFRLRFSNSFKDIQQLINHRHILVNGVVVTSPSFILSPGDCIHVKEDSFSLVYNKI